ncbi:MAG: hypothetical protein ABIX01_17710 [Chitinophagaceae bacterium]
MKNWQKWLGMAACICVVAACFMNWAYYPDLDRHFTGFNSMVPFKGKMINYYGRPGYIIGFFASLSLLFHAFYKTWAVRTNLIFAALSAAFAIKSYFTYTSAYAGNVPVKEAGIFLLVVGAVVNILCVVLSKTSSVANAE